MTTTAVVQMGHVGRDGSDGRSTGTAGEQDYVRRVGAKLEELEDLYGLDVRLIGADEAPRRYRGDVFVALHCDGNANTDARGYHYGSLTPEGKSYGRRWVAHHEAVGFPGKYRGHNRNGNMSRYYGNRIAVASGNRAAWIVELGFLTNPDDRAWLDDHVAEVAHALAAALARTDVKLELDGTPAPKPDPKPDPDPDPIAHPETVMAQLSTVRNGSKGADVRRAQAWLAAAGHVPDNSFHFAKPDGVFGDGTEDAVRAFQSDAGIGVDGIVGPVTWRKLAGVR